MSDEERAARNEQVRKIGERCWDTASQIRNALNIPTQDDINAAVKNVMEAERVPKSGDEQSTFAKPLILKVRKLVSMATISPEIQEMNRIHEERMKKLMRDALDECGPIWFEADPPQTEPLKVNVVMSMTPVALGFAIDEKTIRLGPPDADSPIIVEGDK